VLSLDPQILAQMVRSDVRDPQVAAEVEELASLMWECIDELPDFERAILVLREFRAMSIREVAGLLKVTEWKVRSRHDEARRLLRERIGKRMRRGSLR
jgi:RNA polymerase sigma factor (sigma-70 family)